jgi:Antitoxin VbhA
MTGNPKPTITPEEMQRRRVHVRTAIADSRIEGLPPPTSPELEIFAAYIRGEIEAGDLVTYVKRYINSVTS